MWPLRRPQHDLEPVGVIYAGRFWYAGGLPGHDAADSFWRAAKVLVTEDGLTYRENRRGSWRNTFMIAAGSIQRVNHVAMLSPRYRSHETLPREFTPRGAAGRCAGEFVIVELDHGGASSLVGFRTAFEKDAFALYGVLCVMLARRLGWPSGMDWGERGLGDSRLGSGVARGGDGRGSAIGAEDLEPVRVIYRGRLMYAGGYPGYWKPSSSWRSGVVYVTETGVVYREKVKGAWRNTFAIPARMIKRVEQLKTVRAENRFPVLPANFVTVEMEYNGRPFAVRFRASEEKSGAALIGALNVMLAPQTA